MWCLIGLPGSGKTTVGKMLARRLRVGFFDSDHVIEERLGCSIREFFEREGEERFRDVEESVLDELSASPDVGVLSTGGGSVLRAVNRQRLHERAQVVYLRSQPEQLFNRLRHDMNRPLLQVADPLKRLRELYQFRDPLYCETAHHVLESSRPNVSSLVQQVIRLTATSQDGGPAQDEAISGSGTSV